MISVIMSVKNSGNLLKNSIKSILNQTFQDFELLIIDDFSSDKTGDVLKQFELSDSRIKTYKNDSNLGLTKSLNKLISFSKGDIIARQDADDTSEIKRLEKQFQLLKSGKFEFTVSRATNIQSGNLIPGYSYFLPKKLVSKFKNPFIHGTLMIKKKTLIDVGCYDERYYYSQDFKLFKDLLDKNIKYKYIKEPLYNLNTIDNISSTKKLEQKYYFDLIRNNKSPKKIIK